MGLGVDQGQGYLVCSLLRCGGVAGEMTPAPGVCRLVLPCVYMCSPFELGIRHVCILEGGGGVPSHWVVNQGP